MSHPWFPVTLGYTTEVTQWPDSFSHSSILENNTDEIRKKSFLKVCFLSFPVSLSVSEATETFSISFFSSLLGGLIILRADCM